MNVLAAALDWAELSGRAAEFFSFQYEFTVNALAASMIVGAVCAVVGVFLVLKGLSLLGDAAGHATLPGVCIAFVLVGAKSMTALLIGALVATFLASIAVGFFSQGARTRPDAAIGIVLSVFFGAGILLLSYVQNSPTAAQSGLSSFLFGNAAGVSRSQVWLLAGVGGALVAGCVVFLRPIVLAIFDADFARSVGVSTTAVRFGLLTALSVAVVVSIQAVGVVLVAAMLIIPPSAALLLVKRMPIVLATSGLIGGLSGAAGAFISYLFEGVATGPAMVLVAAAIFVVSLLVGRRGVIRRLWREQRRTLEDQPA
jgi:manganese/zinc/iron transport system permease protein